MTAILSFSGSLYDSRPLRLFLFCVAALFAYGASVHAVNILGLGGFDWLTAPLHWKVFDVVFLLLDAVAVAGILKRSGWGVLAFVIAATLQVVLYGAVPQHFASDLEQAGALRLLLVVNLVLLTVFASLVGLKVLKS